MELIQRLESYISENRLFSPGARILLGVSGGMDSVCLLHALHRLQSLWQFSMGIIHVNHGLRGLKADRDEQFVSDLARHYCLSIFTLKTQVNLLAGESNLSIEEAAREIRFRFFARILQQSDYDKVALAHHADDQAETILMHLFRGSGIRGLVGIRPKRDQIIHPLLFATRQEIETYIKQNNLSFVTDHTNIDPRFMRNRFRWKILLRFKEELGPQIVNVINRSGIAALEAQEYLEHMVKRASKRIILSKSETEIILDIYSFLGYFKIIQKTLLIQILEYLSIPWRRVTSTDLNRIIKLVYSEKSGKWIQVGSGVRIIRSTDQLIFTNQLQDRFPDLEVVLNRCVNLKNLGMCFCAVVLSVEKKELKYTEDSNCEYVDHDHLEKPLIIRTCQPGDWFVPLGMKGRKKLQDFFVDLKVPIHKRYRIPLLVSGGNIVWIIGYRLDDRYKVSSKTKRIVRVEIRELKNK